MRASGVYPSVPPPRPGDELPGLAKCNPDKESLRRKSAAWFRSWCEERGISRRDLQAIWGIPLSTVQDRWNGVKPIHLEDGAAFPAPFADQFFDGYRAFLRALDGRLLRHG